MKLEPATLSLAYLILAKHKDCKMVEVILHKVIFWILKVFSEDLLFGTHL